MHGQVVATQRLTPNLVRIVMNGRGLDGFSPGAHTDAYVNVAIPPAGATYDLPFDVDDVRARLSQEQWPVRRRYTVRSWDPDEGLLAIDFVVHSDEGVGGPWADRARPGDVLVLSPPSGAYRPDPDADWHLMVGDESALPAIAASLEALPADARVVVRLVCDGPVHELQLATPGEIDLVWLHRAGGPADADLLPAAVRELPFFQGRVHAFVHGEAAEVREVRRHLLTESETMTSSKAEGRLHRLGGNDLAGAHGDEVLGVATRKIQVVQHHHDRATPPRG